MKKQRLYRVVSFLKREELDFLDKLTKDLFFCHGIRISRSKLIQAIIQAFSKENGQAVHKLLERRRFVRFDIPADINYRILESLSKHTPSYTKNISEKGIRIALPDKIEPGTNIELTVTFKGDPQPISCFGRVAWIKKRPNSSGFDAGVELTYIKEEDKKRFMKHIPAAEGKPQEA